jgi:hypothetical protein
MKGKHAKLRWLQDPSEINGNSLNNTNIRREGSRYFRANMREYLKDKINELTTNSMNKNIRDQYGGINEFNRGYEHGSNLVTDGKLSACRFPQHYK